MKNPLAVIILNWNGAEDTCACLSSLVLSLAGAKIFVVDNCSEEADFCRLKRFLPSLPVKTKMVAEEDFLPDSGLAEDVFLIRNRANYGFAGGNNRVAEKLTAFFDSILFLNNDTEIPPGTLGQMLAYMDKTPGIGMLSCNIHYHYDPEKLWNAGGNLTFYGDRRYHSEKKIARLAAAGKETIRCTFLTGCALMIRTSVLERLGGFTEDFFFGEEDFNLCMRYRKAGVKGVSLLQTVIYHKVGASASRASGSAGRTALHYLNRAVDMKRFYPRFYWRLWRRVYMALVALKCPGWGFTEEEKQKIVDTVFSLSETEDRVTRETYLRVMGGK